MNISIPPLFWLVCLGACLLVSVSILAAAVQARLTDAELRTLELFPGSAFVVTTPEQARDILLALEER